LSRIVARCFLLLAVVSLSGCVFAQTEFSAEIVQDSEHGPKTPTKMYFAKDKVRFDAQSQSKSGGTVILSLIDQKYVVVMPQQHMYMEMPTQSMEQRGMYTFFRTGDVENACSDWLKMARNTGGTCHKVGNETVNGRNTVKYEGTNSNGESSAVWLDPKLRFPVKWQTAKGSGGLNNIQEGPQPASLFEVPAGYTKMDMGAMMQQHTQK
jgi:outer membrane lipoprotein-sorting protein